MIVVYIIAAALAGILGAALLIKSQKMAAERDDVAIRNACAYNGMRTLMVKMLAGKIQEAADGLPELEDLLAPDEERCPRAHALFCEVVSGYKPPTVWVEKIEEDEE